MDVHRVVQDPRGDVGDVGEVGDGAAELHVEVGGEVAALEVEVDQGGGAARRVGGEGELDGGDGGADAALGAGDGDQGAAGDGGQRGRGRGSRWRRTPAAQAAAASTRAPSSS